MHDLLSGFNKVFSSNICMKVIFGHGSQSNVLKKPGEVIASSFSVVFDPVKCRLVSISLPVYHDAIV